MDYIVVIGSVVASPKTVAFFPLLRKISKTKSIKDNSLGTFFVLYRRVLFWIVCRMSTVDPLVTVGNFFAFDQARTNIKRARYLAHF